MAERVEIFYPGFVKKAITFSIDDGNIRCDRMMLDIVRPAGILGTFNLCAPKPEMTAEDYREMYRGYEISNHTLMHTYAFLDGVEYNISDEPCDPERRDPNYIYRHKDNSRIYYVCRGENRWRLITDADTYIEGIDECKLRLEEIFGEGSVRGFVWPFGEQRNDQIKEYVRRAGYYGVRKSSTIGSATGFSVPSDFSEWSCNARHLNLLEVMAEYESYPDDGELKMFAFGVHSSDFERDGRWDDLREFARKYGERQDEFWYATVGEIYDYVTACGKLEITDKFVRNHSDITLYVKIDGERREISANEEIIAP